MSFIYFSQNSVSMIRKLPHYKEELLEGVNLVGKQRALDDGHVGLEFLNII